MVEQCAVCGSDEKRVAFREQGIDIVRCTACTHLYSTYESTPDYADYWDGKTTHSEEKLERLNFYWNTARLPSYRQVLERLEPHRGRILDVGCGMGFFPKAAADAGWDAYGYEIGKEAVEYGKDHFELENLFAGRVEDSGFPENFFDVVTLWDVIEHIPDPIPLMRYCQRILKPGGVLFMQTPNADFQLRRARLVARVKGHPPDASFLIPKDHLNDFTFRSMALALKNAGYQSSEFDVLLPTYTLAGGRGRVGVVLKLGYYQFTRALFAISAGRVNVSNTIHTFAVA